MTESFKNDAPQTEEFDRSMYLERTILHVGERPVKCERSFNASKLQFQPHKENPLYETTANEIGKIQPDEIHVALKFKPKPGTFVKSFPTGASRSSGLNTSATRERYVDNHTMPGEYGV